MINVHQSFGVPSEPRTVWEVISDPEAVVGCVPGASLGEQSARAMLRHDGGNVAVSVPPGGKTSGRI